MWKTIILLLLYSSLFAEVKNFGVPGDNSNDLLARIGTVVQYSPSVVVVMVGTNDFCNDRKFVNPDEYKRNIEQILVTFKALDIPTFIMTIPPVDTSNGFWKRHDKKKYSKELDELVLDCNATIKQIDKNAIDIYSAYTKYLLFDGVHPGETGIMVIAFEVYKRIKDLDTSKVACFGDSITRNIYAKEPYPVMLERMLKW